MKRIYKYYGLSCFMIALLLFLFLAVLSSQNILSDYKDRLSDMLVQVERKYIQTQKASDDKILLLKKDYINRAKTVRFLLLNDEVYQNETGMRKLKNLMHVDKINVIDHKGIICLSDNPQAVGTDLSKRPEAEQLYQMAIGETRRKNILPWVSTMKTERGRLTTSSSVWRRGRTASWRLPSIPRRWMRQSKMQELITWYGIF